VKKISLLIVLIVLIRLAQQKRSGAFRALNGMNYSSRIFSVDLLADITLAYRHDWDVPARLGLKYRAWRTPWARDDKTFSTIV
jgi:hypothetical protein